MIWSVGDGIQAPVARLLQAVNKLPVNLCRPGSIRAQNVLRATSAPCRAHRRDEDTAADARTHLPWLVRPRCRPAGLLQNIGAIALIEFSARSPRLFGRATAVGRRRKFGRY